MTSDATEAALALLRLSPNNIIPLKRKHSPAPAPPPAEQIINPDAINCICGFLYDDGFSIACDDCSRWCHAACFDIVEGGVPEEWRCWVCVPRSVDRERAVRLQKGRLRELGVGGGTGGERKGRNVVDSAAGKRRRRSNSHTTTHNEEEQITIDDDGEEPWTQNYIPITKDLIPNQQTLLKLRKQATHWRGITALQQQQQPPPPPTTTTLPQTSIHPLPLPHSQSHQILPPSYKLHTTSPLPANTLITPYTSTITPSSAYLADPLNAYAHLGMPKPYVHLLGGDLGVALDARVTGGKGRWVRSGCWPNSVLRPFVCKDDEEGGEGAGERLGFGVFALRALGAGEEVVLGWEWDDGSVVHMLPALIEDPSAFSPEQTTHLRQQMSNLLHALSSTFTTCACGSKAKDCALRRMGEFVDAADDSLPPSSSSSPSSPSSPMVTTTTARLSPVLGTEGINCVGRGKAGSVGEKVDLGPLIGTERGFRTRERVPWSGGIGGVEMDPHYHQHPSSYPHQYEGEGEEGEGEGEEYVDVDGDIGMSADMGTEMEMGGRAKRRGGKRKKRGHTLERRTPTPTRSFSSSGVGVGDVALAFRASHPHSYPLSHSYTPHSQAPHSQASPPPLPPTDPATATSIGPGMGSGPLPTLILSPATASPSPRKKMKMKMRVVDGDGDGESDGDGDDHSQGEQEQEQGRVMIDGPPHSSSSLYSFSNHTHTHAHAQDPSSSSSSLSARHVYAPYYYPSDESTQMQVIKEECSSGEGSDTTEHPMRNGKGKRRSVNTQGNGKGKGKQVEGMDVEEVVEEDKMPPKMRKRWIHQSADALRDMLSRAGSAGVSGSRSGSGDGEGEGERMEVDDGVSGSDPQASASASTSTSMSPHPMPPPPMPASLDPTTVVSTSTFPTTTTTINAHPIRTTSPHDPQTQTQTQAPTLAPSPSTSFAKLSLLSPIVPGSLSSPSILSYSSLSSSAPSGFPFPHTHTNMVPRHNTASPSPLSQSHLLLHSSIAGGGATSSLWRDHLEDGKQEQEPESPQSLASAAAFERKRSPGRPEEHTGSLDEQASPRPATEEETTKNASDTSPPTDPRPPPHRSPSPSERARTPPPTPKVKMSLKDFALRKKKQREEEIANQVTSASPGSTTSALEPAGGGAPTLVESPSPRVNGMEMEDVESREVVGENGEVDAMAIDTPAEEDTSSFPNGVDDDGGESKELTIRIEGSPTHMRSPSPSRSPPPEKDMPSHTPNGTDSLKAKVELVDEPMVPIDTVIPEKALGVKDSQPEPPPPPLNGTADKRAADQNGDVDHISVPSPPARRHSQEDAESRGISPPKQPSSFVPRAHTPPTQPRSFNLASPGSISNGSTSSLPRRPSQPPLARSSTLPLSRPLPSGPRALRAANLLNSPSPFPPGQFIPRGPSADRERIDWDRERSWPGLARGRGRGAGGGWGRP